MQLRCTGPIWTPLIPATMPEEKVKNFGKNVAAAGRGMTNLHRCSSSGGRFQLHGQGDGRSDRWQTAYLTGEDAARGDTDRRASSQPIERPHGRTGKSERVFSNRSFWYSFHK